MGHGRRPATVEELVPDYLPAVPLDPLAADGSNIGLPVTVGPESSEADDGGGDIETDKGNQDEGEGERDQPEGGNTKSEKDRPGSASL